MPNLPLYIPITFVITSLATVLLFYKATNNSKTTLFVLLAWLGIQAGIGLSGFYTVTDTIPPRFLLMIAPPFLLIIVLFATAKGRKYIDALNVKTLTLLHVVRIPVELVLLWLFMNKTVPELMTFEGRNFDIVSGITAPIIYYFGFIKNKLNTKVILLWNFICLGLLINIVVNAVLAAPFPFQQFAFDQPNVAVLYFPFNWLPCCVVPLVLFAHLVSIRQLIRRSK
ncbi:MAG: hypothetical protein Q8M29_13745 [Bacteroidota bacterium]|nr:hypothetical protein [Bacteroidota bacterium]